MLVQRDVVWWLQTVVPKMASLKSSDFMLWSVCLCLFQCLYFFLFYLFFCLFAHLLVRICYLMHMCVLKDVNTVLTYV